MRGSSGTDPAQAAHAKTAVLVGSLIAAVLLVKRRDLVYRRLPEDENRDDELDGIPDIHQREPDGAP
ncbi:hypothetical protein [Streptomyces sp. NPDC006645]|uniref:hypothetical protein n=1 Tax=unclassified Streptomyces TaxID=2593676 RepID=UPI0033BA4757